MSHSESIIDAKTVAKVARLARLHLGEKESEKLKKELDHILADFQAIEELDTEGVAPAYQPHDRGKPLRPDSVQPSLPPQTYLSLSKKTKDGCWLAPRAVEE